MMKKIKAVILDDHITPYRLPLFERLGSEELDVIVLYCCRRLPDREWDIPEQRDFAAEVLPGWALRITRAPFGHGHRTLILNPTLLWRLIRLNPDVVVGYAFSLPAWTAFLYARVFSKRYVSWSTDTLHTEANLDPLQRFSRQTIIAGSRMGITPSIQGVEKFRSFGMPKEHIRVAAQTVPSSFGSLIDFERQNGELYARRRGISGKVVLYVGHLTKSKGMDDLIEVFAQVAAEYKDAQLLLVGSGNLRNAMLRETRRLGIRDRVHFAGFIQQQALASIYASADLFVFPTAGDTFGVVVAEAIAAGLPVVCSKYAGSAGMLVEDGVNGFVVDPRNHAQTRDALLEILRDDACRERMSRASLAIANRWNIEDAASSFRSTLLDAVRDEYG